MRFATAAILAPTAVIVIARFAMLSTAVIFLFASVQFFGANNSRNRLYLTLSLFASLFISLAAPVSTDSYGTTLFTSSYDAYLYTAIALIYAATAFTYIAAVVKDRATHTPGRAASYILLMIGNFISLGTGFISGPPYNERPDIFRLCLDAIPDALNLPD